MKLRMLSGSVPGADGVGVPQNSPTQERGIGTNKAFRIQGGTHVVHVDFIRLSQPLVFALPKVIERLGEFVFGIGT